MLARRWPTVPSGGLFGVPDAWEHAEQAVALARDLDDPALLVRALASCSTVAVYDSETAPPLLAETIERARALGTIGVSARPWPGGDWRPLHGPSDRSADACRGGSAPRRGDR